MSVEWFYGRGGERVGPVSSAELKGLAGSGGLLATDLVWREGLGEWVAAGNVKGLFAEGVVGGPSIGTSGAPAPAVGAYAAAPEAGQALGYYSVSSGMNERTARTLRGFPPSTGARGEWPLGDAQLAELAAAGRHRRAVVNLAILLYVQMYLFIVTAVMYAVIGLYLAATLGGRSSTEAGLVMGGVAVAFGGLAVLAGLGSKWTRMCRIWPAVTFIVIYGLGIIVCFVNMGVIMASAFGDDAIVALFLLIPVTILGLLVWVCVRGMIGVGRFLASPVWAQEALVVARF